MSARAELLKDGHPELPGRGFCGVFGLNALSLAGDSILELLTHTANVCLAAFQCQLQRLLLANLTMQWSLVRARPSVSPACT